MKQHYYNYTLLQIMLTETEDDFDFITSELQQTDGTKDTVTFVYNDDLLLIKKHDVPIFMKKYCKISGSEHLNVSEETNQTTKLYFSGKFPKELTTITDEFILSLCFAAQKVVEEHFEEVLKIPKFNYICFFLQNNASNFRLLFPFFTVETNQRDNLIKHLSEVFSDIDLEELIDESRDLYRPLYRSDEFEIMYTFKQIDSTVLKENLFDIAAINQYFRLRMKDSENIEMYLPFIMSDQYDLDFFLNRDIEELVPIEEEDARGRVFNEYDDFDNEDDDEVIDDPQLNKYKIVTELIEMINDSRFRNEETWKTIGRAICSCCNGHKKGLILWTQASEKAKSPFTKFRENYINTQTACNTFRTITSYAMIDSKIRYTTWHKKLINDCVEKATSCHDLDIAKVLYVMNWSEFVYDDDESFWYQFVKSKWVCIKKRGLELRSRLMHIDRHIDELKRRLTVKLCKPLITDSEKNTVNSLLSNCLKFTTKLKNDKGRNGIISLASEFFHERGFSIKLNKNPNLLGVGNGVIEVSATKAVFRETRPDDYISICTRVPLDIKLTWESECVVGCLNWFEMIFDDPDVVRFFILFSSSLLRAYNNKKLFVSFTGKGNNAKSSIKRLYEETLGPEYCWTFPITLLVVGIRAGSSGPNPEVAGSEDARIAFAQEPKRADKINSSVTKELTGDDTVYRRQLYKEGKVMKISFKIVYLSNKPLQLDEYDQAMKNRCVFVDFGSTFTKEAPDDLAEQKRTRTYKDDPLFSEKLPKLAKGFLWIMYTMFSTFCEEGLVLPDAVRQFTDNYWKENDMLTNFVDECVVKNEDISCVGIRIKFLYDLFTHWYAKQNGADVPKMEWFKTEISSKIGAPKRGRWVDYELSDAAVEIMNEKGLTLE